MVKVCSKCNSVNFNDEEVCYKCGNSISGVRATSRLLSKKDMERRAETGFYIGFLYAFIPFYGLGYSLSLLRRTDYLDSPQEREAMKRDANKYFLFSIGIFLFYLVVAIWLWSFL